MKIIKQDRKMLNVELNDNFLLFNILLAIYNVDDDVCFHLNHFTIHYNEVLNVGTNSLGAQANGPVLCTHN